MTPRMVSHMTSYLKEKRASSTEQDLGESEVSDEPLVFSNARRYCIILLVSSPTKHQVKSIWCADMTCKHVRHVSLNSLMSTMQVR